MKWKYLATVLTNWIYWFSSVPLNDKMWMLVPFLIFDGVRYSIATGVMVLYDALVGLWKTIAGIEEEEEDWYCPTVAVMIVGLNEGDTIAHALESVYGTYPKMELYVVDDGSTDDMLSLIHI